MKSKMLRIGINGFGRIGRSLVRVNLLNSDFNIVLINDIDPNIENHAYLLEYDSIYGRLNDNSIKPDRHDQRRGRSPWNLPLCKPLTPT